MGMVDLDHTLAMARHWGGLPVDTVVIEVEPAEASFGLGFSEELAACLDPILDMVREELGGRAGGMAPGLRADVLPRRAPPDRVADLEPSGDLDGFAQRSTTPWPDSRPIGPRPGGQHVVGDAGVALAGRVRPWGVFVESGGDWFDAVPLDGGALGIVVGNVAGRGVEVARAP